MKTTMKVASETKKYLITKSNDGCVVAVRAEEKTHKTDVFIGEATMQKNIDNEVFIAHNTLEYNNEPLYIYHEDI
jgi:hypothetical protein